jgi:ADP-ribosylglycohydrolase
MLETLVPEAPPDHRDRLAGCLLGTALGDALGLPAEGMRADSIARLFGELKRFRLLGSVGFVSDDSEQSALVAQSLIRHPRNPAAAARDFRRALLGWFLRLPWGIGFATLRACLKALVGVRAPGVYSAGNGAAMRSAIIGVFYRDDDEIRHEVVRALTLVTHTHPLAVDGARFVANLAAGCANTARPADRYALAAECRQSVSEIALGEMIDRAIELAKSGTSVEESATTLGTTGYVLHSVPFAVYCFLRHESDLLSSLSSAISAGGDTDSNAAILGAWLGALNGTDGLPLEFGPTHLISLAASLSAAANETPANPPGYSIFAAFIRNILLYPVIVAHGFRRLIL